MSFELRLKDIICTILGVGLLCSTPNVCFAQPCLADLYLQNMIAAHPEKSKQIEALERYTKYWISKNADHISNRAVITIPIVVHVVWKNAEENISEEQIRSQIEVLNQDFRALNQEIPNVPTIFKAAIADLEFEFCLARRTPQGTPTNGITRTRTNVDNIATTFKSVNTVSKRAICYTDLGGRDAWDTNKYLNIWVGKFESGLGEANFPGTVEPDADGVRIDPSVFGNIGTAADAPYNRGRTATHEIGHYFNLLHPWGASTGNCNNDDGVEDTPRQFTDFRGICPTHPQLYCGTASMFMNFMNYSNDACLTMFTKGQNIRVLAALNGFRAGLLTSNGCDTPTTQIDKVPMAQQIQVLGNPTQATFRLSAENIVPQTFTLQLVNLQGQLLWTDRWFTGTDYENNDYTLKSGIYFLIFKNENNRFQKKIIITY